MANRRKETSTTDFFLNVVHKEETNKKEEKAVPAKEKKEKKTNIIGNIITVLNSFIDFVIKNKYTSLVLSFVIALVLFMMISGGEIFSTASSGATLKDVPLLIEGLDDQYEITGVPDTIDIGIIGPSLDINSTTLTGNYEAYINVEDLEEGKHTVDIETRNFPDSLDVMVLPQTVTVTISPKVSQKFSLSYKFINEDQMNGNYSAYIKDMAVKSVTVRASESTLQSIHKVVACIDVSGVSSDFEQDATIKAYNSDGDEVDVEIAPNTVHVECGLSKYVKSVPIQVNFTNSVAEGYAVSSYKLSATQVKVYGEEDDLKDLEQVTVDVDLSGISENTTLSKLKIKCDQPYNKLSRNTVDVDIEIDTLSTVTFNDLQIQVLNLAEGNTSKIDETASVEVSGGESILQTLTASDITVSVDADGLKKGTHKVQVNVSGSNDTLTYTLTSNQKIDLVIGG